ncbi:MAG TPA: hypothetical protein P5555_17320 [Candidatus Paceibacterota bacterium]|nr:hypothetical protein [Verrucomicrobiota bacterium]HRZ46940.1 hypothetical protein [Candidatus Paceibacterota bacterium]HRZ92106.1 hypothetical protein [Candidatus Paceibacterota bacterium]
MNTTTETAMPAEMEASPTETPAASIGPSGDKIRIRLPGIAGSVEYREHDLLVFLSDVITNSLRPAIRRALDDHGEGWGRADLIHTVVIAQTVNEMYPRQEPDGDLRDWEMLAGGAVPVTNQRGDRDFFWARTLEEEREAIKAFKG